MLTPEQLSSVAVINFGDALAQATVRKLLDHAYAQQARIAELEQDAARYRSICRDVASEWGNFAGGADECLRRIEAYEQSKETP